MKYSKSHTKVNFIIGKQTCGILGRFSVEPSASTGKKGRRLGTGAAGAADGGAWGGGGAPSAGRG